MRRTWPVVKTSWQELEPRSGERGNGQINLLPSRLKQGWGSEVKNLLSVGKGQTQIAQVRRYD